MEKAKDLDATIHVHTQCTRTRGSRKLKGRAHVLYAYTSMSAHDLFNEIVPSDF